MLQSEHLGLIRYLKVILTAEEPKEVQAVHS